MGSPPASGTRDDLSHAKAQRGKALPRFPWVFASSLHLCAKISLIRAGNFVDSPTSGGLDQRYMNLDLIRLTRGQGHGCGGAVVFDLRRGHAEILFPALIPIL